MSSFSTDSNDSQEKLCRFILRTSQSCAISFEGTESERLELLELRNDLGIWQKDLVRLSDGCNWPYPYVLRMLNISEHKLRHWEARVRDEEFEPEDGLHINALDEELAGQMVVFDQPRSDVLDRIVAVVTGLHRIWVAVCVRFAEAVASKYSDLESRIYHCRGVVDFDVIGC